MNRISRDILDRIAAELKLPPGDPRVLQMAYRVLWELATGEAAEKATRVPNPMLPASDDPALRTPDQQDLTDLVDSILEDPKPRTEYLARPAAAASVDPSTAVNLKSLLDGLRNSPAESPARKSAREWVAAPVAPAEREPAAPAAPPAPAISLAAAPALSKESPWAEVPRRDSAGFGLRAPRGPRFAPRGARLGPDGLELTPESAARQAPAWLFALAMHLVAGVILMNIVYFTAYTKPSTVFRISLHQPAVPKPPPTPPADGTEDRTVPGGHEEDSAPSGPRNPVDPNPAGTRVPAMPEVSDTTPSVGIGTTVLAPGTGISGANGLGGIFEGRGGMRRRKSLLEKGGDKETEEAVARGLRWLAEHQEKEGAWGGRDFANACRHPGMGCLHLGGEGAVGMTGLALLAFAGSGITHEDGGGTMYDLTVKNGISWLLTRQNREGRFVDERTGGDYNHAIVVQALCELYAMTQDPKLRTPCERAIRYLEQAQQENGGWDYHPERSIRSDVSVTGWVVLALRAARVAGFPISAQTCARAGRFLQDATDSSRPNVAYQTLRGVREGGTIATQAVGLYAMRNLGVAGSSLDNGLVKLLLDNPPRISKWSRAELSEYGPSIYYIYYAGLCLVSSPDAVWLPWNDVMKKELLALQVRQGGEEGSWPPFGRDGVTAGRQYMTAMAVLSLEVYYRFTPALKAPADPLAAREPGEVAVTESTEPAELSHLLRSTDMRTRREASREICRRADTAALPALLEAIRIERTSARRLMIQDLTGFRDNAGLPGFLVELLDDSGVQDVTMKVLTEITGEGHTTVEEWKKWWESVKR